MEYKLSLTQKQYFEIFGHNHGVSFAICGVYAGHRVTRLLVQKVLHHNNDGDNAEQILKSIVDDPRSRNKLIVQCSKGDMASVIQQPHAKLILQENDKLEGYVVAHAKKTPISCIKLVGDNIQFWYSSEDENCSFSEFAIRHIQLFGQGTYRKLKRLKIAVVGCSGTGSPVIEQLARLGVGHLILVDSDCIEEKNVNRIINSCLRDSRLQVPKVIRLQRAIKKIGLGTKVEVFQKELSNPEVVRAVAGCDLTFGCMDTVDGRHLLNRLATFYLIPYFDIGVKLVADGNGGIEQVCGTVHYLQPGGSSLLSRRAYTTAQLEAANLKRTDKAEYEERVKSKYIEGIQEDRPAVISVNMLFAAFAVNEFLARLHPFRDDDNSEYSTIRFSLTQGEFYRENDSNPCAALLKHVGRGDVLPLLDMPELSEGS